MSPMPTVSTNAASVLDLATFNARKPVSTGTDAGPNATPQSRARAQAQDFEAMVLGSMFKEMFTGIGKEGPLGDGPGTGVWRSFLTDEYAKGFARKGGVGIADTVYAELLGHQEARAAMAATIPASAGTRTP